MPSVLPVLLLFALFVSMRLYFRTGSFSHSVANFPMSLSERSPGSSLENSTSNASTRSGLTPCPVVQNASLSDVTCRPRHHPFYSSVEFHERVMKAAENQRVVLVGDSLTRYLYLSLARFLVHGTWGTTCPNKDKLTFQRRVPNGWTGFYEYSNAEFQGLEQCDCYRRGRGKTPPCENRYLLLPNRNLSVTYLQFRKDTIQGHNAHLQNQIEGTRTHKLLCRAGHCQPPYEWSLPLLQGITNVIKRLKPTYLIFNRGAWGCVSNMTRPKQWVSAFLDAVSKALPEDGMFIWRSTTGHNLQSCDGTDLIKAVKARGWQVYDSFPATQSAPLADKLHYDNSVYADLNSGLLSVMFKLPHCVLAQPDNG